MSIHPLLRGSLGLALSISMFAQARGGGAPAAGSTGTAPPTTTPPGLSRGGDTNTLPGIQPNIPTDMMDRPMFLSGKVVMPDGTPPPEPVVIQIVCRGIPRGIAYTDAKGNFGADLSNRTNNAVLPDATESSAVFRPSNSNNPAGRGVCPGEANFVGAEVQAYLPGFRSDVINLGMRRSMDNPDVGTLVLRRLANVEGLTISATSAMAPKDAKKAFERAHNDTAKQKWTDAHKELEKAVALYPKYAAAWFELGNVQQEQKDLEGARKSYAQSLAADPKFVSPYLQLASLAAGEQKWQEVADGTDRMVRMNPVDFPQAWYLNALANYYLGKKDVAEKSAREGISHDPAHHFPRMNYLLGVLLAQKADYSAAAESLRDYLRYAPRATDLEEVKKQLAEVEKAAGPEAKKQ